MAAVAHSMATSASCADGQPLGRVIKRLAGLVVLTALIVGTVVILPSWRGYPALLFGAVYGGLYLFLLRVPNGGTPALTAPHLFAVVYTAYVSLPALVVFLLSDTRVLRHTWTFPEDRILIFALLGFTAFISGTVGAYLVVRARRSGDLQEYRHRPFEYDVSRNLWAPLLVAAIFSVAATAYFFWLHRDIYLTLALAEQIGAQRPELRAGAGYLTLQFVYVQPWLCILAYLGSKATGSRTLMVGAIVIGTCAFLAQAALLFRGNLVIFFLLLLVASQAIRMEIDTTMLKWAAMAVLFFVAVTALRVPAFASAGELLRTVGTMIASRMATPIEQFAYVLDTFPRAEYFPGETYLIDISALRPGAQRSFNGLIYREMGGAGFGSATITILGESYANFGIAGIFLVPFCIGFALQALHHRLLRSRKRVLTVFLYTLAAVYTSKAVLAGLTANLIQPVVVFVVLAIPTVIAAQLLRGASATHVMSSQPE